MDEKLVELFMKWLKAFESVQAATKEKDLVAAHKALSQLETQIAATPAEGLRGLVVKLGLHQFLNNEADAASMQVDSAYADLVRLTGRDPPTMDTQSVSARSGVTILGNKQIQQCPSGSTF